MTAAEKKVAQGETKARKSGTKPEKNEQPAVDENPSARRNRSGPVAAVELKSSADLGRDPENPREIEEANLAGLQGSLADFGDLGGITFNLQTGQLVTGHQRVESLERQMGGPVAIQFATGPTGRIAWLEGPNAEKFPLRLVEWSDDRQRAANLAANNPHLAGHFSPRLQPQLDALRARGEDMFKALRLDRLAKPVPRPGKTGDDATPAPPPKAKTKPGDLYRLGEHRLLCGDSTSIESVQKLLGGGMADCLWTDPPYGVAYVGKTKDAMEIENDDLDENQLEKFLRGAMGCAFAVSRPGAAWYVAASPGPLNHIFSTVLKDLEVWRQTLNWIKSSLVLGRSDYHYQHEPIFYGWKPGAAHNWYSDRKQTSTLNFDKPNRNDDHPTMKPVGLVAYCIGNSSQAGETVLDIFGGSGTTLIACEKLWRKARLMEIDPKYCDVIVRRWEEFTGRKAELVQ